MVTDVNHSNYSDCNYVRIRLN